MFLLISLFRPDGVAAQGVAGTITGTVVDKAAQPVVGATVYLSRTKQGTVTDVNGQFKLGPVADGEFDITVSYVGYESSPLHVTMRGGQAAPVRVALREAASLNDVVVTGVLDRRTALNSSIAISSLNTRQIQVQTPVSAAALLRNVSGVYVNSANGEVGNTVYSRGASTSSSNVIGAQNGYYYVSLQEDGLPVSNFSINNVSPDYFLRADVTLGRLEAVKGGTASIIGANAPGGIFNYLSRTGGDTLSGEFRARYGIEGTGNSYYRGDLNIGGPLTQRKDLTFNVGGFYRYDQGVRYAGFPLNVGGQVKANIVKTYASGSVKVYAKYLNDRNGGTVALPVINFDHMELAPGVKNTDTYLLKTQAFQSPYGSATNQISFDPSRLQHSTDLALGVDWTQRFGKGWTLNNNLKFSHKEEVFNANNTAYAVPLPFTSPSFYFVMGTLGRPGTYTFTNPATGASAMVKSNSGYDFNVLSNSLPGKETVPGGGLIYQGANFLNPKINEVLDQLVLNKRVGTMGFTVGGFFANTNIPTYANYNTGLGFSTIENQPTLVDVKFTSPTGVVSQITNPQGYSQLGGGGFNFSQFAATQQQLAGFFGYNWQITPQLNFDGGIRYEHMLINSTNSLGKKNTDPAGGLDGNPLTLYDNNYFVATPGFAYEKVFNTVSYSAGLNYTLGDNDALYMRYSEGQKVPNLAFFTAIVNDYMLQNQVFKAQVIRQFEVGYKVNYNRLHGTLTPFYSQLSNVQTAVQGSNTDGSTYFTIPNPNKTRTYGLEVEGSYDITRNLNLRGALTLQNSKNVDFKVWDLGANGPQDDKLVDYSGTRAEGNPNVLVSLTPTFSVAKFYAFVNWQYMSARQANAANTFELPGYSQFDFGAGYNFTRRLSFTLNMNNVLNSIGFTNWLAPGGTPVSYDLQGFSPAKREANPNAVFSAVTIQPRSTYLSLTYHF